MMEGAICNSPQRIIQWRCSDHGQVTRQYCICPAEENHASFRNWRKLWLGNPLKVNQPLTICPWVCWKWFGN